MAASTPAVTAVDNLLRLAGDCELGRHDSLQLVNLDGVWQEVSRSIN
jgi:hypothetical protein